MWKALKSNWFLVLVFIIILLIALERLVVRTAPEKMVAGMIDSSWSAPSLYTDTELEGEERKLVMYGEELIAHTSKYLGPQGSVAALTNGMNCQNCHLDAGTRPWGNNYGGVFSTYPRFRERSGSIETIYKRVNDCMERSLNGQPLDSGSREMKAIYAYMKWLGKDVPKSVRPVAAGLEKLPYLDRAADQEKGRIVYQKHCSSCHGEQGEGIKLQGEKMYAYPPLWGANSYNDGAGLYRLSNFASYVKNNMPFEIASHEKTVLSLEEAWDVAAFVNSQPRPHKEQSSDWPDISKKPVDFPFGPYADSFPESQHKYGPYKPIVKWRESKPKP